MCDADIEIPERLIWDGWETTLTELIAKGWVVTTRPKYHNWRDSYNSNRSNAYMYIRNYKTKMIGRLRIDVEGSYINGNERVGVLDYLTHEKTRRVKPNPVYDTRDLTVDDIPLLMKLILELQSEYPPARTDTNIIQLPKRKAA